MAYKDIRPYKDTLGGANWVRWAPMKASETFEGGELIYIDSSGYAATLPKDGTQALLADISGTGGICGVAINGPGAAASAAVPTARAWVNPDTGSAYATGDKIYYHPAQQGNLFIAPALVAGGASGKSTAVSGAARGIVYELTYESASTPDAGWGVELTAGVTGTDILARVWDVLDSNYLPIAASASTGVWVVFEIVTSII